MLQISPYFKDSVGRSALFSQVIWGNEWEALGLPKISPADRQVYCHLFQCAGNTGLAKAAIARAVWGSGNNRNSCSRSLERLSELNLVEEKFSKNRKHSLWFAILPDVPNSAKSAPYGAIAQSDTVPYGIPKARHMERKSAPYGTPTDRDVRDESSSSSPVLNEYENEPRDERRSHSFDFSKFEPLPVVDSNPIWLDQSLAIPDDPRDLENYLTFAARCACWHKSQGADPVEFPSRYIAKTLAGMRERVQSAQEAIQAALKLAKGKAARERKQAEQAKQRSENAGPNIPKFSAALPNPADCREWIEINCPEFHARLVKFEATVAKNPNLEQFGTRARQVIEQTDQRRELVSGAMGHWGAKALAVGQLNSILKRARRELQPTRSSR